MLLLFSPVDKENKVQDYIVHQNDLDFGSSSVPFHCFLKVLLHSFSLVITMQDYIVHQNRPAVYHSAAFSKFFSTPSLFITIPKIKLRPGMTLIGSSSAPFRCFLKILLHSFSMVITNSKITLCTTLIGKSDPVINPTVQSTYIALFILCFV